MITIALCDVAITITNTKHLKKVLCTKASKNKKVLLFLPNHDLYSFV